MLTVVIPALNAEAALEGTVASVTNADEIVVVDGGSSDATPVLAARLGARVVAAPRGRGPQLAAGVAAARGEWLLLLHADTRLASGWRRSAVWILTAPATFASPSTATIRAPDGWSGWSRGAAVCWHCRTATRGC